MTHTPGPWKAQRDIRHWTNDGALTSGSPKAWAVYGPYRVCAIESGIGIAWDNDIEAEANARLIAAAPALLAALEECLQELNAAGLGCAGYTDNARATIAAAKPPADPFTTHEALNGVAP